MKNLLLVFWFVSSLLPRCVGIAKHRSALTDVFPLRLNLQYSYRFYNNSSESYGQQVYAFVDSGSVIYIIRDSTISGDTMIFWQVEQRRSTWSWKWNSSIGRVDTPRLRLDTTRLNIQEMISGYHELRVSSVIWNFPLTPVAGATTPVCRFADSAPCLLTCVSWIGSGGAHSEDTVSLAESEGLTRRSYSGWFDSIPWDSYFGYALPLGTPTSLVPRTSSRPATFALQQNYPNPFNPSTSIRYSLPRRSHVTLTVFNILGQLIATLVNWNQEPGVHDVWFDGVGLASGVYFYRLRAGSYYDTKKMIFAR